MFRTIITGSLLMIAISIFYSYQSATKPHRNILMGVLLPVSQHKNPEVLTLVRTFRRINILMLILFLIAVFPIYYFTYTSFILLYMGIWCTAYYMASSHCFHRYFIKLLLMKSENKWFPLDYEYRVLTRDQSCKDEKSYSLFLHKLIPTNKERLLAKYGQPIYVDEDEYWINGYYYNPDDKRTMVEKRVGFGTTANLASKPCIIGIYVIAGLTFAFIIGLILLFFTLDFTPFNMSMEGNTVKIDAPLYDYQFEIRDITGIFLTDTLPKGGIRTNGAATDTYYLGNFRFDDYGSSKVYIYRNYPPYLIVTLPDKTVLFNAKSEEDTKQWYDRLQQAVNTLKE